MRTSSAASLALVVVVVVGGGCDLVSPSNPFDPSAPPETQAPASITGTVRDASRGEPLEAVVVTLFDGGDVAGDDVTDADGAFGFDGLVPGGFSVDFAHPTHLPTTRAFLLVAGDAVVADVTLTAFGEDAAGTGHITGVVQKSSELARPEAVRDHSGVTVEVGDSGVRTTTNAAGRFDLALLPGSYDLAYSAPGHASDSAVGVVVVADETTTLEPVVLQATPGSIAGVIALEGGGPVAATVSVDGTGLSAVTDAAGSFLIGAVPAGAVNLSVAQDDFFTASVNGVVVVAGDVVDVPRVTLARARGAVEGRVDLVGRSDDSGVAVSLSGTPFAALTSEAGTWRIDGVPVGTYEVTAVRDGFLRGVAAAVDVNAGAVTTVATLQLAQRQGDFDIDGGAQFTRDNVVELALDNPDAAFFMASEDASFSDPDEGDVAFRAVTAGVDVDFTVSAGDGEKTVFVLFKDGADVVSGPFSSSIVLDTTAPAPPAGEDALVLDGGALFSNNAGGFVRASLLALDATSGLGTMRLSTDANVDDDPPVAFQTTTVIALAAGADGPRDLFVRFTDVAGNDSAVFRASITLDRTPPNLSSVRLNAGDGFAPGSVVVVDVAADDALAGVARMAFSTNGNFAAGVSEPFTTSRTFFLAPGEGRRDVFVQVIDAAGNESDVVSDDIVVDGSAPAGGNVSINNGAVQTSSSTVTLTLSATGATKMRVVTDGVLDTEPVEDFVASRPSTTLAAGDGVRGVFVVFLDDAGNAAPVVSDTIVVDAAAPTTPLGEQAIRINGGAPFTNDTNGVITLALAQQDAVTSVATMQLSTDGTLDNEAFVPFQSSLVFTVGNAGVDGTKTILVRFRDAAGNTSGSSSASIVLDRAAPSVTSVSLNAGAAQTTNAVVDLAVTASDALSGVKEMALSTQAGFPVESFEPFGSPRTFVLAAGDGSRSAFVKVRDAAGNVSTVATDAITVDTQPPSAGSVLINGGAEFTNSATTTLTLQAAGAATMTISTDGVFDSEVPVAFAASASATFSGQGPKTVFVLFADAAGNVAAVVSDSIVVDSAAPAAPSIAFSTATPGFTSSTSATVVIGGAGASLMKLRTVEDNNCAADPAVVVGDFAAVTAEPFALSRTVVLPANVGSTNGGAQPPNRCKHVQLLLLDDAGNNAAPVQARIELDQLAPDAPRIGTASTVIDDDNDGAADFNVALAVDALDHNFDHYELRNGGAGFVTLVPNLATFVDPACINNATTCTIKVTLNQQNGARTENRIEIRAVDRAGTPSAADLVIVTEDSDPPDAPATVTAVPADREITLSWPASVDVDVKGYLVGYAPKNGACPTTPAGYVGASLVAQGPSPLDVGLNRTARLTGFSNNIEICVAVWSYDNTVVPAALQSPTVASSSTTPSEVGLVRVGRLTSAQLGIGAGIPRAVALRNGMLYIAASGAAGGLIELDASDEACFALTDPVQFQSCTNLKKSATPFTDPRDLKLQGGYAFVADGVDGTRVLRVDEGRTPTLTLTIPLNGATPTKIALSLALSSNFLAVGRSSSTTRAFDGVVDIYFLDSLYAAAPTVPGLFTNITQDVAFFGDPGAGIFGFTSLDFESGVLAAGSRLFSVSIFGTFPVTQPQEGGAVVELAGRFLFAANDDNGPDNDMHVADFGDLVDVNPDPNVTDNRARTVSRALGTAAHRIELLGPYALVAGRGFLDVYDASDRRTLRFVTTYRPNHVGGGADSNNESVRGSLAVDGNRVVVASATVGEVDVLRFGDAARLEAVSSIEEPGGGPDSVSFGGDSVLQGRSDVVGVGQAPSALLHLGRDIVTIDGRNDNAAPNESVAVEGDVGLLLSRGTFDRVGRAGASTTGLFTQSTVTLPANTFAHAAVVRWPWAVIVTTTGNFFNPGSQELRVFDLRPIFGPPTQLSSTVVATTAAAGFNGGPAAVAVHGGFVYVAVADNHFNFPSAQAVQGLYRATFNSQTGAVGAFTQVEGGAVTSVVGYGRRVFWSQNNGGFAGAGVNGFGELKAQTLANPDVWSSSNVVRVTNTYAYEHRPVFAGPVFFLARDLDGVSIHRVDYDPVTFRPLPAQTVLSFDPGADAHSVQVVGDRAYFHQIGTGGLVFRTR